MRFYIYYRLINSRPHYCLERKLLQHSVIYNDSSLVLLADCQILHFVLYCDAFGEGGIDGHSVGPIGQKQEAACSSLWPVSKWCHCRHINQISLLLPNCIVYYDPVSTKTLSKLHEGN